MLQTINLNLTVSFRSKNNLTFKIQFKRYTIKVNSLCFIKKMIQQRATKAMPRTYNTRIKMQPSLL